MKKVYYITFGQISPFKKGWVEILATDKEKASEEASNRLGNRWSMIYEKEPEKDLFPQGQLGITVEGY